MSATRAPLTLLTIVGLGVVACSGDGPAAPPEMPGEGLIGFLERIGPAVEVGSQPLQLAVINRDGTGYRPLTRAGEAPYQVVWSVRGGRVAYTAEAPAPPHGRMAPGVFVRSLSGGEPVQVAAELGVITERFDWSPDGSRLVIAAYVPTRWSLWIVDADGSGLTQLLEDEQAGLGSPTWSPDGAWIAFAWNNGLWKIRPDGSGRVRLSQLASIVEPTWAPDGRSLFAMGVLDTSPSSGRQTWIMDADGSDLRQLSGECPDGVRLPFSDLRWSPDGQRLLFVDGHERRLHVLRLSDCDRVTLPAITWRPAEWSPDGRRILYTRFDGPLVTVALDGMREDTLYTGPVLRAWWLR